MAKTRLAPGERKKVIQLNQFKVDKLQEQINQLIKAKIKLFVLLVEISSPELRKLVHKEIDDADQEITELNKQQYRMGSLCELDN